MLSVSISRDGTKIVTGSADKTARVWNLADGKTLATLSGHAGPITSFFSPMIPVELRPAPADRTVRVWDTASGRELQRLSDHASALVGVAILPDNKSIVSAGADNAVRVWVPAAVRVFAGHQGPISSVAVLPNGTNVVTGSADKSIKIFDVKTGNLVRTLAGHTGAVKAVAVTPRTNQGHLGLGRQDVPRLERGRRQAALDASTACRGGDIGRGGEQQCAGGRGARRWDGQGV